MRSRQYGPDALDPGRRTRRPVPSVPAQPGLVVEDAGTGVVGAVVRCDKDTVTLRDRRERDRVLPLVPGAFLLDGERVTLVRPAGESQVRPHRTASGSVAVHGAAARVARAGRIYVEGRHDAELVERVWGDDLRLEGVVVEPLDGIDDLPGVVRGFGPRPGRRLGVLVDHLVTGTKESRIVGQVSSPHVLVTGHPYVDVWQAVRPAAVGIPAWPVVPPGQPWKEGVCAALGAPDPREMWRRVLASVSSYADLETPLIGAVERLIDFVIEPEPVN